MLLKGATGVERKLEDLFGNNILFAKNILEYVDFLSYLRNSQC